MQTRQIASSLSMSKTMASRTSSCRGQTLSRETALSRKLRNNSPPLIAVSRTWVPKLIRILIWLRAYLQQKFNQLLIPARLSPQGSRLGRLSISQLCKAEFSYLTNSRRQPESQRLRMRTKLNYKSTRAFIPSFWSQNFQWYPRPRPFTGSLRTAWATLRLGLHPLNFLTHLGSSAWRTSLRRVEVAKRMWAQ
jgi:hypothetical protein